MKRLHRMLPLLLLCAFLLPLFSFAGCELLADSPAEACVQFLEHIRAGEYAQAYEMLHSSVRYDAEHAERDWAAAKAKREQEIQEKLAAGEPVDELRNAELVINRSRSNISRDEFIKSYTDRFELLDITGFSYAITSSVEGEVICVYDYTLRYDSTLISDDALELRMSVRREGNRWTIEWTPALVFPDMEWGDTIRKGTSAAWRGEILSDGILYAQTVNAVGVLAFPAQIEDIAQFARQVSALTELSIDKIIQQIENTKGDFTLLKRFYPDEFSESLESQLALIKGVSITKSNAGTLRNYPQGDMLAHIIGYVGPATEEDLTELTGDPKGNSQYNGDSYVGKTGLERVYEKQLRGKDGSFIFISNAEGLNKRTLYIDPAQNGLDLQLTLDAALQEHTDQLLRYSLYGDHTAGAVIVMNPATGKIEAMAAYPSYDLNLFARGMSELEWTTLSEKENKPMFNRLTQGRYPPGSIFKPFTAAAALESGAITPETVFPEGRGETIVATTDSKNKDKLHWLPSDNGEFGPWVGAKISRVTLSHRHSPLNMRNGMMDSDNIYFAYAALKTGIDYFTQFTDQLGLNAAVPFDVSVNPAQMKNAKKSNGEENEWHAMLLAESAFGQGEVLVTPLQAASLFSCLANNGTIMRPYMVEGLYRVQSIAYVQEEVHTPEAWKTNVLSASSVATIEPMLEAVIKEGTGSALHMDNIAGKTGTAQIGDDRTREISWFVGYRLRTDSPRLVLVMLETPANNPAFTSSRFEIARALLK